MRPPHGLLTSALFYLLVAAGCALVACLLVPVTDPPGGGAAPLAHDARCLAALAFAVAGLVYLLRASVMLARGLALWRCNENPTSLEAVVADLDHPQQWRRRLALQRLAAHAGEPFGFVACWPFQKHSPRQFKILIALYKAWWQQRGRAESACAAAVAAGAGVLAEGSGLEEPHAGAGSAEVPPPSPTHQETLRQRALAALRDRTERALDRATDAVRNALLGWNQDEEPLPAGPTWPLPPLDPDAFLQAVRPRVEEGLRRLVVAINEAATVRDVAACEPRLCGAFDELLSGLVQEGLRLRLDDAVGKGPNGRAPAGAWVEKYRRMLAAEGRMPAERGGRFSIGPPAS